MEFNSLTDLLNTGFTIIEIGLICFMELWWRTPENENMQIPDLF